MEVNKENLLRSTIYDNEIESNSGNEKDVIPELWKCFPRKHPGTAKGIKAPLKEAETAALDPTGSSAMDPPLPPVYLSQRPRMPSEKRMGSEELMRRSKG